MRDERFDYAGLEVMHIDKDLLPYRFDLQIAAQVFSFEFRYNATIDVFTVDLYRENEVLVYGEPIVYGLPLFEDMRDERFPPIRIVPWNIPRDVDEVTYDNLGEDVRLYLSDALCEHIEALLEVAA